MKTAQSSSSLLRTAIVAGLIAAGLATAWIVVIGPAILNLLSAR